MKDTTRKGGATVGLLAGLLVVGPLLAILSTGCSTAARGGPSNFASVVIDGHTSDEIRRAAIDVFTSHYYTTAMGGTDTLVFEKAGGGMDNLLYGGWSPGEITIRVKVHLSSSGPTSYLVSCQGFMVRDANDPMVEDEQQLSKMRRSPYQKLLEEVREKVSQPASTLP
jgi:hypothetical protein